jgi:hypothetical protein
LGPRSIPIEVGQSSGNNLRLTVPLPRARVTATISRRPICDLVKCTTDVNRRTPGNSDRVILRWRQTPTKVTGKDKDHVPPGQSIGHAIDRAIHSLLR